MISKVGPNHHDGLQENQVQYFLSFFFLIMWEWVATRSYWGMGEHEMSVWDKAVLVHSTCLLLFSLKFFRFPRLRLLCDGILRRSAGIAMLTSFHCLSAFLTCIFQNRFHHEIVWQFQNVL